jgi:hypothetical protein
MVLHQTVAAKPQPGDQHQELTKIAANSSNWIGSVAAAPHAAIAGIGSHFGTVGA